MPICEICNKEVEETITCSQCEAEFCEFCGDESRSLCDVCRQRSEEDFENDFEEDY